MSRTCPSRVESERPVEVCESPPSQAERAARAALQRDEALIERSLNGYVDISVVLQRIHDDRSYQYDYPSFDAYCRERWGWTRDHVSRLKAAAAIVEEVGCKTGGNDESGQGTLPIGRDHCPKRSSSLPHLTEWQMRPLGRLKDPEDRKAALQEALDLTPGKAPTAKQIEAIVDRFLDVVEGDDSEDEEEDSPRASRSGGPLPAWMPEPGKVQPSKWTENFVDWLNNVISYINESGGAAGCSQGWTNRQKRYFFSNVHRFSQQLGELYHDYQEMQS